ncbi:putative oxidoreductase [Sodalis glossinidius str. 'morsitans']|uniref:Dehydrogenase n=1 Tax=Sodalis glossinidius (strain morsitans) TaxID=343509 RepID=Q2NVC5_SODGM|nr:SDR family oxidoreductase [Sodalis glossinidius]BAE73900.1 putative dehydrogenase [Sodalis glossinidius str. 'morsitans']CRL44360.1 putative oxidoreductase [Sodalis glossinidius str. 'morsitans']
MAGSEAYAETQPTLVLNESSHHSKTPTVPAMAQKMIDAPCETLVGKRRTAPPYNSFLLEKTIISTFLSTPDEVAGKVVLVTSAASGIDRSIAELMHQRGARVIAEDVQPEVNQLAAESLVPLVADIIADGAAEQAVALAQNAFGRLDVLVNCAGRILYKPLIDITREEWHWQMETNVTGAFLHSREAMKAIMPQRSGAIVNVNIASYAAYFAFPGIAAYTASKGALVQLNRTQALETIAHGIRVNAIGVGNVVTNIINHFREDGREFLAEHGRNAPIGRAA